MAEGYATKDELINLVHQATARVDPRMALLSLALVLEEVIKQLPGPEDFDPRLPDGTDQYFCSDPEGD